VLTCHNGFNEIAVASSMPRTERRKFTIEELKRICSFPDDYAMRGTYAEQWARCGDAVPPVMMAHVARALIGKLK
jgi:DNA (cytosine-5)-methyltransferase 1